MAAPTKPKIAKVRNAPETRERILDAARRCFSQRSYENIGVRDIGQAAGVDAALVNRYFGNKEGLFAQVINGAFHVEEHLPESLETLGEFLVAEVIGDAGTPQDEASDFNPLRLLLLAAASPDTAPMVAERFHAEFVLPLAGKLRGRDAELRASLIASYVIGLATMSHLLQAPALKAAARRKVAALTGQAIQACVGTVA